MIIQIVLQEVIEPCPTTRSELLRYDCCWYLEVFTTTKIIKEEGRATSTWPTIIPKKLYTNMTHTNFTKHKEMQIHL